MGASRLKALTSEQLCAAPVALHRHPKVPATSTPHILRASCNLVLKKCHHLLASLDAPAITPPEDGAPASPGHAAPQHSRPRSAALRLQETVFGIESAARGFFPHKISKIGQKLCWHIIQGTMGAPGHTHAPMTALGSSRVDCLFKLLTSFLEDTTHRFH